MRTEKQIEASRANGAKSLGPTTPEGKAASSSNATTHGLTSRHPLLLNVEQQAALQNHLAGYINWLKPDGPVETDIVEEMVTIQWRRQRREAMEASLVQLAMDRMAADVDKQFNNCPHSTRTAMAMEHLEEKGRALGNFQRHSLRLSRQFLRLHKTLRELKADRAATNNQTVDDQLATEPNQAATVREPEPVPPTPETQNEQIEPKDQQLPTGQIDARPPQFRPALVLAFALANKPAKSETDPSTNKPNNHEATKCAGN